MNQWTVAWKEFLRDHPSLDVNPGVDYPPVPRVPAASLATDEVFWQQVRNLYPEPGELINLNSGAVSSSPRTVEKAFLAHYQLVNQLPSYYLFKYMEQGRELIREGLAGLVNCSKDEVAFLRNTTEALNNVIFGIPLEAGDEVVACRQDYSKAVASWKQRELRENIRVKWVNLEGPEETDEQIVSKYLSAITPRTKVLFLTHVVNWNGQVLPVAQIIREAKKRNVEVVLDGAHSFGLLETDLTALGCDYFVAALHKWLSGPIPSAMLYVRADKISGLWPLASGFTPRSGDIRKFEELSIQLMPTIIGLGYAMEFYTWLGRENKEHRLRYLRRHWTSQLRDLDGFRFRTPEEEERNCVIVNMAISGREPAQLEKQLLEEHKIHITAVQWENMPGIRITPNVYTGLTQLDAFVRAMREVLNP
jgi:selenocysteine lyase/cysteine desulfurase